MVYWNKAEQISDLVHFEMVFLSNTSEHQPSQRMERERKKNFYVKFSTSMRLEKSIEVTALKKNTL